MSSIDDNVIVELDNVQKELLLTNLDDDGKLSCLKAFKVARLIGRKPIEMSTITKTMGIKITNCELGVFGKLKFKDPNGNNSSNKVLYCSLTLKNFPRLLFLNS